MNPRWESCRLQKRRFNKNNLPDYPFPPGFFDEAEDEEIVARYEIDREDHWDEQRWRQEKEKAEIIEEEKRG